MKLREKRKRAQKLRMEHTRLRKKRRLEQTLASSRLRTQAKRTNATLKPTLTTVSHGPQPRIARQWPLPWPEAFPEREHDGTKSHGTALSRRSTESEKPFPDPARPSR